MADQGIRVAIYGDYDDRDINKAIKDLNSLKSQAAPVGDAVGGLGSKLGVLGTVAAGAAVAGVAIAGRELVQFGQAAVTAAQDSQVADARLNQIAKSMGLVSGAYAGGTSRLSDYASTLSKSIGVEDESIKAVQAKLLTFKELGATINVAGGSMDRATEAAFNLASAGFGTAEGNATMLGKALQDPVKGLGALSRAGVTFTDAQKEQIKAMVAAGDAAGAQNMILGALEQQVGGTAAATATSAQKMNVSFSELQESIGSALLPVLNEFMDAMTPIIDQLQGPLTEVAKQVAGALSEALKSLLPVLPTLATAIGQLAGTIGQGLATAIKVLVPIVTPLLEIFAQLATRIGPILQPILEKVGVLLGKIFDAVMPLLQPLMDLVFTILEAALPIFDVVADLLGVIIDAFKPLLTAVSSLLAPLGELVKVLFSAIEPILRPLIPLLEIIGTIFADVLTRAIGLLTTAIGYVIVAWSKFAPFVLDNVVIPVIGFFTTLAQGVLDRAEAMFGWIPGLGDKFATAKTALETFKTDSTKAIGEAADKIVQEGTRIGQGLVDQGVNAMTDPASINRLTNAGQQAGYALARGFATGAGDAVVIAKPGFNPGQGSPGSARRAGGGPVSAGFPYIVGDGGRPELFIPRVDGTIIPRVPTSSAGNSISVTVQAGVGDPRAIGQSVVEAITRYERANGPVFARA